jgi:hypothetical protein
VIVASCALLATACKQSNESRADLQAKLEHQLAGAQPGEEREIEPGTFMAMFRTQATAALPDGWQLAASTKGRFSVEIPLPFNDFRIRSETEDHVELDADIVGAKSPGLLAWSATCAARADGKRVAAGSDAIEPIGTPVKAWQRTIGVDGRTCVLVVEAQGTDPLPPDADIQRFLRSFKRT